MLKVWRGKSAIFAECSSCGSYGTANHLQPTLKMDPDIEAAVERHTAHMLALRSHYTTAANKIVAQIRGGALARKDGSEKIKELYENHVAQVRLAEAALPNPAGKVKETVVNCPWCGAAEHEQEIAVLPDDQAEPVFSLAQKVTPVKPASLERRK